MNNEIISRYTRATQVEFEELFNKLTTQVRLCASRNTDPLVSISASDLSKLLLEYHLLLGTHKVLIEQVMTMDIPEHQDNDPTVASPDTNVVSIFSKRDKNEGPESPSVA